MNRSIAAVLALLIATPLAAAAAPSPKPSAKPAVKAAAHKPADKTVTMPDGLKYLDETVGKGRHAMPHQTVSVHYVGTLADGKQFDSSRDRGAPFEFTLGEHEVIACWDEGVATMRVGGRRKLICPPALAYGDKGAGDVIKPGATLTFDVELLGVKP